MHILSVDDNPISQKLMTKLLSRFNCTVATVFNGQEALSYLSNPANPPPDLIFMDLQMPVLDGISAASIIRTQPPFASNPVLRTAPIIAVGAHGVRLDREAFAGKGESCQADAVVLVEEGEGSTGVLPGAVPVPEAKAGAGAGAGGVGFRPAWGPMPLRGYRGPRSLL
ncbi:response regulator [Aspergillus thermomutatus]|uniref:Response regulatory domain-containing protein n=1 Tax=Aspergillus thermomutatus TaxID=41047 RepID=A0A397G772_ASPTH|nr:uncharacterized protein CDV56_101229 [Aspergillus thermomutatus]RHZ45458.1 hypothetical protein CDV56_101229 [Aspergillus thermomutatus]